MRGTVSELKREPVAVWVAMVIFAPLAHDEEPSLLKANSFLSLDSQRSAGVRLGRGG